MLKLVGRNLLSKRKHKYWRYARYSDAIKNHLEWIIENLENSKNGHISVRVNDITKEMGPNFSGRNCTLIFPGLRYALFEEGIIIEIGKHMGDDIFTMRFANNGDGPSINENIKIKSRQKCRNNDVDPDSIQGFGYITEVLVAKFLGIKTCFDMTGNFNYGNFDIYEHEDFGRINVKGSKMYNNRNYYYWQFNTKKNKIPDFFFCIGYNDIRTDIESVYIIPNENYVVEFNCIYINKYWDEYEDPYYWFKEDPKPWNDLFHTLELENCPVLKTRI